MLFQSCVLIFFCNFFENFPQKALQISKPVLYLHSLNETTKVVFEAKGGLAEWSIATVLKTVVRESGPGVRLPQPPQQKPDNLSGFLFFFKGQSRLEKIFEI